MKKPFFSIIVPVYKVDKFFLKECIDSILFQSFENFELILVDDGSPDDCGQVCDDYAKHDKRIKVVHQTNQGVSVARNNGMDNMLCRSVCCSAYNKIFFLYTNISYARVNDSNNIKW